MKAFVSLVLGSVLSACASAPPQQDAPATTLRALYRIEPTSRIRPSRAALVLVDFQEEFFHGKIEIPDGASALECAAELLAWARRAGVTIVHVRNVARPGSTIFAPGSAATAIVPALAPRDGEIVVTKSTGGAFTRTDLDATLRARGIDTIIIGGIMAHLAVALSAQDGSVLGYRVIVASDATATRDLPGAAGGTTIDRVTLARASLAALADRFADVMPTEAIVVLPLDR